LITPRGIAGDFRIAENRLQWRNETNELTLVEKKGADDDILIEQSKTLKRVENRIQNLDVIPDKVTDTTATAALSVTATTGTIQQDASSFVNSGRNRLRDAITNETAIGSFQLEFSTASAPPVRSDNSIASVQDTQSPAITTTANSVTYTASTTATGIQTIGISDNTANTLLAVARLSEPVDAPAIDLTIKVANKDPNAQTLWTESGIAFLRDILAGTTPNWPLQYAYGSDPTPPATTDVALGTAVTTQNLNDVLLESVDSNAEWDQTVSIASTDPLQISNGQLTTQQSSFIFDAPTNIDSTNGTTLTTTNALGGTTVELQSSGDFIERAFNVDYEWPDGNVFAGIRAESSGDAPELTGFLDGTPFSIFGAGVSFGMRWFEGPGSNLDALSPGRHTIRVEVGNSSTGSVLVDALHVRDDRFNYTFDNTTDNSDNLSGPENHPDAFQTQLKTIATQRDVTQASVSQNWTNTANNQSISLRIGTDPYTTATNTQTLTVNGGPARTIDVRATLSRYASNTTTTPTTGDAGQAINLHELFGNPDAITADDIGQATVQAIIPQSTAVGDSFAESGLFDSTGNLLTSGIIPTFDKQSGQLVISAEKLRFIHSQ